ncbi:MAG: aminopeptidase P family protein [Vulcanimicrobiaceae bacterium]
MSGTVAPQSALGEAPVALVPPVTSVASHDDGPPQALLDFMVTGWLAPETTTEPLPEGARFAARRERLSALFPHDLLVVPTGHEKTRANDTTYRFRPGTDFYYLTGNLEADCVLVMRPSAGGHDAIAYVEPNLGKTDATFYTDRAKGELWVGPRLGVAESAARFSLEARSLRDLERDLATFAAAAPTTRVLRGVDPHLDRVLATRAETTETAVREDVAFANALSELRLIKDDYEIAELERAIAATKAGFDDVLRGLATAQTERHVEGAFNTRARIEGNDVGYGTIAASGRHACTLHWTSNDGVLRPDDLLLLDAGVEAHTLYTADVTRTIPLGGRFSREQRELYELVFAAQEAALGACRPGNDFMAPNAAAMEVLAHGLERLGILPMPAAEALRETNQFYKRYSLHNVSHMLGLDVHDCAQARAQTYKYGTLEVGMVLTVEPGCYLQPDDATVPERYRGIGVRIEDDIVITPDGYRNLSAAFPREISAVEAWVAGARA